MMEAKEYAVGGVFWSLIAVLFVSVYTNLAFFSHTTYQVGVAIGNLGLCCCVDECD